MLIQKYKKAGTWQEKWHRKLLAAWREEPQEIETCGAVLVAREDTRGALVA